MKCLKAEVAVVQTLLEQAAGIEAEDENGENSERDQICNG